jgi:hypothetical protein
MRLVAFLLLASVACKSNEKSIIDSRPWGAVCDTMGLEYRACNEERGWCVPMNEHTPPDHKCWPRCTNDTCRDSKFPERSSWRSGTICICTTEGAFDSGSEQRVEATSQDSADDEWELYRRDKARADAATESQRKDADAAEAILASLQLDLHELDERVGAAVGELQNATSQHARESARSKLTKLQEEQSLLRLRVNEAQATYARLKQVVERMYRQMNIRIPKKCIDNPLSKRCEL